MWESKIVWFLSAALIQAATALAMFKDGPPTQYQLIVVAVGAIAQGLLAWRAFVKYPPEEK